MGSKTMTVYDRQGGKHELGRAEALIQLASGKVTLEPVAPIESASQVAEVETAAEQPKPTARKKPAAKK